MIIELHGSPQPRQALPVGLRSILAQFTSTHVSSVEGGSVVSRQLCVESSTKPPPINLSLYGARGSLLVRRGLRPQIDLGFVLVNY